VSSKQEQKIAQQTKENESTLAPENTNPTNESQSVQQALKQEEKASSQTSEAEPQNKEVEKRNMKKEESDKGKEAADDDQNKKRYTEALKQLQFDERDILGDKNYTYFYASSANNADPTVPALVKTKMKRLIQEVTQYIVENRQTNCLISDDNSEHFFAIILGVFNLWYVTTFD